MRRITAILLGFGLLLAGAVANGSVTISVRGRVTAIRDLDGILGGTVHVGDPTSATYTYESTALDEYPGDDTQGMYGFYTSASGFKASAGGLTMQSDPLSVDLRLYVYNNYYNYDEYCISSGSYSNLTNLPIPLLYSDFYWRLNDHTCTALSSDALPTDPPDLSKFASGNSFTMSGLWYIPEPSHYTRFTVTSEITTVILGEFPDAVPEPATVIIWSLLGGLGMIFAWRGRKAG